MSNEFYEIALLTRCSWRLLNMVICVTHPVGAEVLIKLMAGALQTQLNLIVPPPSPPAPRMISQVNVCNSHICQGLISLRMISSTTNANCTMTVSRQRLKLFYSKYFQLEKFSVFWIVNT